MALSRAAAEIAAEPPKFIEIAGIADLRAWSNGATIIYVNRGKVVNAVIAGTANEPTPVPPPGTRLYSSTGKLSGWITPEIADAPLPALPPDNASPSRSHSARSNTPPVAENGSYYGQISMVNGLPRTHLVNGYYRRDGTYVRGYYRSR